MNIGQTIYIALLAVVAIASFTSGKSITNAPNGNQICFPNSRPYSGLPWPLTDARDIGQIIGHGAHCVSTVQGYAANPPSTPMDVMHQDHCLCFLHRMLDFWTANPSYAIPAPLCDDIRRPYINAQQQELPQLWDFYIYDPRFNNNGSSSVADLMNTFNGLAKQAVGDAAPQDLFGLISGQHLGDILLRDYENGRASLSAAEQEWIGHWEADQATRMSALGVVCVGTNEHASHSSGGHHGGGGNVKPVIANGLYYPPVETLRTIVSQTRFNKVGSCSKWGH